MAKNSNRQKRIAIGKVEKIESRLNKLENVVKNFEGLNYLLDERENKLIDNIYQDCEYLMLKEVIHFFRPEYVSPYFLYKKILNKTSRNVSASYKYLKFDTLPKYTNRLIFDKKTVKFALNVIDYSYKEIKENL
jgi:hypothetical protein